MSQFLTFLMFLRMFTRSVLILSITQYRITQLQNSCKTLRYLFASFFHYSIFNSASKTDAAKFERRCFPNSLSTQMKSNKLLAATWLNIIGFRLVGESSRRLPISLFECLSSGGEAILNIVDEANKTRKIIYWAFSRKSSTEKPGTRMDEKCQQPARELYST